MGESATKIGRVEYYEDLIRLDECPRSEPIRPHLGWISATSRPGEERAHLLQREAAAVVVLVAVRHVCAVHDVPVVN